MPIPEKLVAEVVAEVSARMADPGYAQVAIGGFAQSHPDVGRFITAQLDELGGGEAVMHCVFHAEVMNECFRRHLGRDVPSIGFSQLDAASGGDPLEALKKKEPALADYVASNVETAPMRSVLALVGLAMTDAA